MCVQPIYVVQSINTRISFIYCLQSTPPQLSHNAPPLHRLTSHQMAARCATGRAATDSLAQCLVVVVVVVVVDFFCDGPRMLYAAYRNTPSVANPYPHSPPTLTGTGKEAVSIAR